MGVSPRDLYRNGKARKTQNPTSVMETGIPPKSQKSGAILLEKMELQLALAKECDRKLEGYGNTLQGMDRMLMEYDNQIMECQMQLSKYDNQLMESQKMLSECSSRLIDEVPNVVLTRDLLDKYDGAIAEYKGAVDKYYGLVEQYQEQINKMMGTEEDRMAGVQMALDLTYIKEELDELKQDIEAALKSSEPEEEENADLEDGEQMVEKFFDQLDQTNLLRFQKQISVIEEKTQYIVQTVQDIIYTQNVFTDERFKHAYDRFNILDERFENLEKKIESNEGNQGDLDEKFRMLDAHREEGIISQNQTITEKLQAQNRILEDKLETLNGIYTQTLEEKLLVQSKTMVDKLQVQNHFTEELEEAQNQFIEESLEKQNEFLTGKMSVNNKSLEEFVSKQGIQLSQRIEELLKKPEGEEDGEELRSILKESQEKLKEDKDEIIRKMLGLESIVKDEKGQVTTAKSELTVLIDRTVGPLEKKISSISRVAFFSFILNLISLFGIVALLMKVYGL